MTMLAHLLFVHQAHGIAQRQRSGAGYGMTHGEVAQPGVQRVLRTQGFDGLALHLLVDLVEQAAHPAQGEITEHRGQREPA